MVINRRDIMHKSIQWKGELANKRRVMCYKSCDGFGDSDTRELKSEI